MVARLHLVLWLDHKGIFVGKVLSPDVWIQILAATARRSPLSRFTFRRQRGNKSTGLLASAKPALSDGHFLPRASSFRQGSLLIGWLGTRPLGTAQRPLWSLSRPLGLDPSAAGSMVLATTCGA